MTSEQAQALSDKWQQRLGLGEWQIAVVVVPGETLADGNWGSVHSNSETLEAVIELPADRIRAEIEQTICHELAHLLCHPQEGVFEAACTGMSARQQQGLQRLWDAAEERICNRVARGLTGKHGQGLRYPERFIGRPAEAPDGSAPA